MLKNQWDILRNKMKNKEEEKEPKVDQEAPDQIVENDEESNEETTESSADQELHEIKDKYLRLLAEFENYKKRTFREKLDTINTAARETILAILPVLDDFDRAKSMADDETKDEAFSDGVLLVYNKLNLAMKNKGLLAMETTGKVFDAEFHEAVTEIPAPSEDQKGVIIDTIEKGYTLNDKIIRHAKVVVGK